MSMARTRNKVHATRRAADGTAFEKCDNCGVPVAIALAAMHECEEPKKEVKRFRGFCGGPLKSSYVGEESTADQPRSAVCFFTLCHKPLFAFTLCVLEQKLIQCLCS
ncbi:uncharacterized protein J3R85_009531 [Psidium guajava]|nr:uncharacterized protein J3R85_009531 [Psidium guajava]